MKIFFAHLKNLIQVYLCYLQFLEADMQRKKKRKESTPDLPKTAVGASSSQLDDSYDSRMKVQELVSAKVSENGRSIKRDSSDCEIGSSGTLEFELVRALRMKEVEWQAWPKAFLASEDSHSRYN